MKYNKKNGFTLIEVLIGLTVVGMTTTGFIISQVKETKSQQVETFINGAYDIIRAVDHRIAVDGYDPVLWSQTNWTNENEIVNNLIGKQLNSKYLTNCIGGEWDPVFNAEHKTKLIGCNHWKKRKIDGEILSAELVNDSVGFIQTFNLYIQYSDIDIFKEQFLDLKKAINNAEFKINQEITGSHYIDLVSMSTKNDITSMECLSDFNDCAIKLSIDRNGGNEYLRADGSNSMIGEHLTFIESKGQAPMGCVRWVNTARDGSGSWRLEPIEECGIGIYKNDPHPVMVDVVADTGTFKNILLDQECNIYGWDGSDVIDTGNKSPCGSTNNGSEIIQVLNNIQSEKSEIGTLYAGKAYFKELLIKKIVSDTITSEYAYIEQELQTDLIQSYTTNADIKFNSKSNMLKELEVQGLTTLKAILQAEEDVYLSKNAYITGDLNVTSNINSNLNITAQGKLISNGQIEINQMNTENSVCMNDGSISRTTEGALLNCVSGTWASAIKDSMPVGTVVMWASSSVPKGWLEMNGQSTSVYPELRAIVGSRVPDLRGQFVRGWDRGRGLDLNRSLKSEQGDAIRNIYGYIDTYRSQVTSTSGVFTHGGWGQASGGGSGRAYSNAYFDASRVVPTANENRPTNIALMYIIKAK